uniref:AGC-kinase C-terminal domain-containing protein n=1 Tax=Seriola lalandi dorsalis TaxID=1841481 RepID=A0A3B4X700_SERLL
LKLTLLILQFIKMISDLLRKLLVKDPHKRLGSGPRGAEDIKAHHFFKGLNWADLSQKKLPSPFKPELKSELDVGNFAEEFTGMDPVYSPASTPPSTDRLFQVSPCCVSSNTCKRFQNTTPVTTS